MKNSLEKFFKILLLCAATLACAQSAVAQSASEFFMLGNNAYKVGDYKKAVECYESAIEKEFDGAAVRYNLANALAKLDKKGEALLNYKRAVYNAPRMREASANLQMFAKDNAFNDGFSNFATPLIAELSDSEWTSAAFIAFWGAILSIFIPPLFGKRTASTVFIAILFACLFWLSSFSIYNWWNFANSAVAVKNDVPLRISPTQHAPISSIVSEGQVGAIEREHGDFIYVETTNGKKGWTKKIDFVPVVQ